MTYPSNELHHTVKLDTGGFPSIRHDEVRDLTASMLRNVCHDVCVEPNLQPLSGEVIVHQTAIVEDGARLDISACGFEGGGEGGGLKGHFLT